MAFYLAYTVNTHLRQHPGIALTLCWSVFTPKTLYEWQTAPLFALHLLKHALQHSNGINHINQCVSETYLFGITGTANDVISIL